jgi:hypothetical protein
MLTVKYIIASTSGLLLTAKYFGGRRGMTGVTRASQAEELAGVT